MNLSIKGGLDVCCMRGIKTSIIYNREVKLVNFNFYNFVVVVVEAGWTCCSFFCMVFGKCPLKGPVPIHSLIPPTFFQTFGNFGTRSWVVFSFYVWSGMHKKKPTKSYVVYEKSVETLFGIRKHGYHHFIKQ